MTTSWVLFVILPFSLTKLEIECICDISCVMICPEPGNRRIKVDAPEGTEGALA